MMKEEQQAFDQQILERVEHGHVPDLRHGARNEWFYNNVWRDPEYVKMSFLENITFLQKHLNSHSKILEVGCGPGHNSLELARQGHHVTGIDLSSICIEVARKVLAQNTHQDGFGTLSYCSGNFLEMEISNGSFDAVLFYGALSHFPNLSLVLDRVWELLNLSGKILIWDTSVDLYSLQDASLFYLTRALLSATGHYYQTQELAHNEMELNQELNKVLNELKYVSEDGSNLQSPNDNSQTHNTMISALDEKFHRIIFSPESCFYRNMIGGIRCERPEEERKIASFIKLLDGYLIKNKILNPTFFYYIGEKRR